jgi:hypothetical protein
MLARPQQVLSMKCSLNLRSFISAHPEPSSWEDRLVLHGDRSLHCNLLWNRALVLRNQEVDRNCEGDKNERKERVLEIGNYRTDEESGGCEQHE